MNETDFATSSMISSIPANVIAAKATATGSSNCQVFADDFKASTHVVASNAGTVILHKKVEGPTNNIDSVAARSNKDIGRHPVDDLDVGINSTSNDNSNRVGRVCSIPCGASRVTSVSRLPSSLSPTAESYNNITNPYGAGYMFPQRLRMILDDAVNHEIIHWDENGKSFKVYQKGIFEKIILPRYFLGKQTKYWSFTRKLGRWGFIRIKNRTKSKSKDLDSQHCSTNFNEIYESGSYYHPLFVRDDPELISKMKCSAPTTSKSKKAAIKALLAVGKGVDDSSSVSIGGRNCVFACCDSSNCIITNTPTCVQGKTNRKLESSMEKDGCPSTDATNKIARCCSSNKCLTAMTTTKPIKSSPTRSSIRDNGISSNEQTQQQQQLSLESEYQEGARLSSGTNIEFCNSSGQCKRQDTAVSLSDKVGTAAINATTPGDRFQNGAYSLATAATTAFSRPTNGTNHEQQQHLFAECNLMLQTLLNEQQHQQELVLAAQQQLSLEHDHSNARLTCSTILGNQSNAFPSLLFQEQTRIEDLLLRQHSSLYFALNQHHRSCLPHNNILHNGNAGFRTGTRNNVQVETPLVSYVQQQQQQQLRNIAAILHRQPRTLAEGLARTGSSSFSHDGLQNLLQLGMLENHQQDSQQQHNPPR